MVLKFTKPLLSCCCPVQKFLPRLAELAWQLSRYLWRGSVNFKINSIPLFTIIFKLKNGNFMTRDFSLLIERVLTELNWIVYILEGFETLWKLLENGGKIWISIWYWSWIWVKSRIKYWLWFKFKFRGFWSIFKKIALIPPSTWQWCQGVTFS